MTSDGQDRELLARIAKKDATAVQALFARHQTRIFRFILRFVRNEAIAEELCNEVFLEVWRKAGSYRGQSAATTWLMSIARNKAISLLRKHSDEELDESEFKLEMSVLEDIGLNSVDFLELAFEIEKTWDITINDEEFRSFSTVEDVVKLIISKVQSVDPSNDDAIASDDG